MKDKSTSKTSAAGVEFLKTDGLTTPDPASQNGAPSEDPWKDAAHDGRPRYRPGKGTKDILMSDQIVGLDGRRTENFQVAAFYDPVRDVQPTTPSGPAPMTVTPPAGQRRKTPKEIADEAAASVRVGDPWPDQGDDGIEVYPGMQGIQMLRKLRSIIPGGQAAAPGAGAMMTPKNINTIGAKEEQPLEPLREPSDLDVHLVVNHYFEENPTLYPIDQLKDFHMQLHQSGQSDHNPEVLKVANILDPIQETLDPAIWDNPESVEPRLKPSINSWVTQSIFLTLKNAGYKNPEKWIKLIVTGSLTTYQWSKESDLDVSIWVDLDAFPEFSRSEMIKVIIENLDGNLVPGTSHPIQCFVVDVSEIKSPQEIYKEGVRSAYQLDTNEWIVKPERDRSKSVPHKFPELYRRAKQASAKMQLLLKYQPEAAKTYWHFLHKRRREDMKAGLGDYSESNIIYKMLSNDGLFTNIADVTGEYIA